jgi:hypothetical protein
MVDEPKDRQTFNQSQKTVEIKGQTETNAVLTINDHLVVLDHQGKFNYPVELNSGENLFTLIAGDQAGNHQETQLTLFGQ